MDIALITDYRGWFWSSLEPSGRVGSMNVQALAHTLRQLGARVRTISFPDIDLGEDWTQTHVLYTSSEDSDLHYKSYVEDVVLGLDRVGARLIVPFDLLRAHHNKAYMEILRQLWLPQDPMVGLTAVRGTREDLSDGAVQLPAFVKAASGAGSRGVFRVNTPKDLWRRVSQVSATPTDRAREYGQRLLRFGHTHRSLHRRKFIVQSEVPGLAGDFKVLRYGDRFFAVYRRNRVQTGTASGAGLLDFEVERYTDVEALLCFAADISEGLRCPLLSLDIADSRDGFRLLEFQGVHFGPVALQHSRRHWLAGASGFAQVQGSVGLEETMAEAIWGAVSRG